jgi:hypothetical protein
VLVFAHRATLTHFLLLYPDTRFRSWPRRWVVAATYAASFVYPIGQLGVATAALFVAVLVAAVTGPSRLQSANRRSARLAGACAALVWGLLTVAAVARLAGVHIDGLLLVAYEIALLAILAAILIDNRYRRSRTTIVTNLAVDLGEGGVRSLRDVLADVLGDPSVVVGLVSNDGSPMRLASGLCFIRHRLRSSPISSRGTKASRCCSMMRHCSGIRGCSIRSPP